jgi:hypothetical protein
VSWLQAYLVFFAFIGPEEIVYYSLARREMSDGYSPTFGSVESRSAASSPRFLCVSRDSNVRA